MSEKEKAKVNIDGLAQGGDGVGRLDDGRVIFVPRSLPGDEVLVELVRNKKTFARGRILNFVARSKARVEPACPAFVRGCGGCRFWHTTYANELELKSDAAYEALKRISKIELPAPEVVAAPSPRRYRNRVTFHWRDKELGFFAEGSRKLIEVVDCPITDELLIDARRFVEGALAGLGEAEVTLELAGNEQVVVSIAPLEGARVPRQLRQGLERLLKETSIFRGFIVEMPAGNLVIGEPTVAAERGLARPPIEDVLLPARQFRQVNDAVNQLLVDHVQDRVREIGKPRVLELYSGAGNFAFALKGLVSGLVGVEGHEVAVETARGLAQQAGLKEFSFEVADLSEGLRGPEVGLDLTLDEFDLLLLDPPRQGAHALCKELVEMKGPEHILYISCDPPCLGRDLQVLGEAGYRVTSLSFFDMFPRTAHIETVAQLTCISD